VSEVRDDGARYFGPFESATAARQALTVGRAVYPEAFERKAGAGPVRRQAVLEVCKLLAGQKDAAIVALRSGMREAAERGDRPEVDRLRATLLAVQELVMRPSILVGLPTGWRLLVVDRLFEGGPGRLHLIQDGRLLGSADTDTSALPTEPARLLRFAEGMFGGLISGEAQSGPELDPDADTDIDVQGAWSDADTAIVLRWLVQTRRRLEIERLPS
jgi:hypothetical protein